MGKNPFLQKRVFPAGTSCEIDFSRLNQEMIDIESVFLIIIGVLLFELIVFVHEFGHFITAKKCGVKVNEFALGRGPKLVKFQKGETLYSLRMFPIGGFCSMEGEDAESTDTRSFNKRPVWQRMLIVVAGAIMNLLLGFVLMIITLSPDKYFASNQIVYFMDNAPSSQTLELNDEIQAINGYHISTAMDMNFALATAKSNEMTFDVKRNGEYLHFDSVKFGTVEKNGKEIIQLDFKVAPIENNFLVLIGQSFLSTVSTVRTVCARLLGLVTGQFGFNEVAGPIGMTSAISQAASEGLKTGFIDALMNLIYIMTIITVNLGVVNLLPLPALDGGRFIFLLVEAIRRKPVKPEHEGIVHAIGMIALLIFMVVISINDIIKLFSSEEY